MQQRKVPHYLCSGCLLGAFIYFWVHDGYVSIRLILGIIFVFITAPVSGHLICRAAYRSRVPLAEGSGEDELKPVLFGEEVRAQTAGEVMGEKEKE